MFSIKKGSQKNLIFVKKKKQQITLDGEDVINFYSKVNLRCQHPHCDSNKQSQVSSKTHNTTVSTDSAWKTPVETSYASNIPLTTKLLNNINFVPKSNFNIMYSKFDCSSNLKDQLEDFIKLNNVDKAFTCETLHKKKWDPLAKKWIYRSKDTITLNPIKAGVCIIFKEVLEITENKNL